MTQTKDFDPNKLPENYDNLYDFESGMNIALIIVHCWVSTIAAYTRRSFGTRHFGVLPLFFLFLPVWFAFGQESPIELGVMFVFAIGSVLLMMINTKQDRLDGRQVHSRYSGWPRVCDWLSINEYTAKAFVEPMLVVISGGLLLWLGVQSLGCYLILGGAMMSGSYRMARQQIRRQARDVRDAEIYSDYLDNEVEQL